MATVLKMQSQEDQMTLLVKFEKVYGNVVCYPVNEQAQRVAKLAGTKTLTPQALKIAKEMGFKLVLTYQSYDVLEKFLNGGV